MAVLAAATTIGATATSAVAAPTPGRQDVSISSDAGGFHLSATTVQEGPVTFRISTTNANGFGALLFRLNPGVTFEQLGADLQEEFSTTPATAAAGTRDLVRDVILYGLSDAKPNLPTVATANLAHGRYYVADASSFGSPAIVLPTAANTQVLRVNPPPSANPPSDVVADVVGGRPTVSMTSTDRFSVQGQLHAAGSLLLRNVSDTLHFLVLQPVQRGTTDAQIQAFFDGTASGPPPFTDGPSVSTEPLSPAKQIQLAYVLPTGTYVLMCFVSDPVTGMPHAFMGMHQVLTLN